MDAFQPERLLTLWEQGVRRHPIDRSLLLLALAAPQIPVEQLADEPINRCNAALMDLRRARFGHPIRGWIDCPHCSERMELCIDADQLPPAPDPDRSGLEVAGRSFRFPTHRDLADLIAATERDPAPLACRLLRACAESADSLPDDEVALETLLHQVDAAMEQQDPWIDPCLELSCLACGQGFSADLDIAALLWDDIDSLSRRLLDDVHRLAQAYGWAEAEILRLSEQRRSAYLERLGT